MAASKSGFMKDALILFAITLVSGLCLGVELSNKSNVFIILFLLISCVKPICDM